MLFQFFSVLSYIHTLLVCLRLGRTWLGFHYERREWLGLISASNSRKKGPKEWADKAHAIPKYLLVGIKHNKLKDEGGHNTIPLTYSPNFSSITHCSLYVLEDDKAAPLFAIPMPISYLYVLYPPPIAVAASNAFLIWGVACDVMLLMLTAFEFHVRHKRDQRRCHHSWP